VRYTTHHHEHGAPATVHRSGWWRSTPSGWRCWFHQATLVPKPTDEAAAVAQADQPTTQRDIESALRAAGVASGSIVIVHCSMSQLGRVVGNAVAVGHALRSVVGADGTIVMPAQTGVGDPSRWQAPPVPEAWWPTIRANWPVFDTALTSMQGMGAGRSASLGSPGSPQRTLGGRVRRPRSPRRRADAPASTPRRSRRRVTARPSLRSRRRHRAARRRPRQQHLTPPRRSARPRRRCADHHRRRSTPRRRPTTGVEYSHVTTTRTTSSPSATRTRPREAPIRRSNRNRRGPADPDARVGGLRRRLDRRPPARERPVELSSCSSMPVTTSRTT
jgi:hypothetical protein